MVGFAEAMATAMSWPSSSTQHVDHPYQPLSQGESSSTQHADQPVTLQQHDEENGTDYYRKWDTLPAIPQDEEDEFYSSDDLDALTLWQCMSSVWRGSSYSPIGEPDANDFADLPSDDEEANDDDEEEVEQDAEYSLASNLFPRDESVRLFRKPFFRMTKPAEVTVTSSNLEVCLATKSSLFGTEDKKELFELDSYAAPVAGYFVRNYQLDGDVFRRWATCSNKPEQEVQMEFEGLWLEFQFFWEMMLRMHPNSIIDDIVKIGAAVDLLCDIVIARLAFEVRKECTVQAAKQHIKELRRRLQRFQLSLRTAVSVCGEGPKLLGGCALKLKQYADKDKLWGPLFSTGAHPRFRRSQDMLFSIRDMACLLRLEDFLTFVSHEIESQSGLRPDDNDLLLMALGFIDDKLLNFINETPASVTDLELAWLDMLCRVDFRQSLAEEVKDLVKDAVAFDEDHEQVHREECEFWTPPINIASNF
ncbi:hypothetical protein G7046_g3312 [Stylonectria norvegica]|nr:hypothetical protein G7046_g3312 [Stylonectria norvegica]